MQTFNPVYIEHPLKSSAYVDIAYMIRAAAKNFSGKGLGDPIWEESAFNLTKNVVAYCAAIMGYFTLQDCYKVMIKAGDDELIEDLKNILGNEKFDNEEAYNIKCAIQFFVEYAGYEDKIKSSILFSTTSFLNQFQDYKVAKIFCPTKEDLTIHSMDKVIDEGKILIFNVQNEALAKSMGTFIKLHYQRSVLNRLKDPNRSTEHLALLVADEYQYLVSVGNNSSIGDDKICALGRESNFCFLAATQSLNSLYNAVRDEKAVKELVQNFRTRIACHSSDVDTIKNFQELMGHEDKEKTSHSISESSQKARRNFLLGGFDSNNANINESISTSQQKEYRVTGKDFSELKSFEAYAQVYDGIGTTFHKLFLKPYFLKKKHTKHENVLEMLRNGYSEFFITRLLRKFKTFFALASLLVLLAPKPIMAFPNICSIVNTPEFNSCLNLRYTLTTCGSPPFVKPCYRFYYMVPQTFLETSAQRSKSHFTSFPGAAVQLSSADSFVPFGAVNDEDTQSYQARSIAVPFAQFIFNMFPCGGTRLPKLCFDAMSEHIESHWATGKSDKFQPKFLAWMAAPKACLIKGAVTSPVGDTSPSFASDSLMCSIKLPDIPSFPPSTHSACNGWGAFYPRMGSYNGPASLTGALMIASRMKSISSEVFKSAPSTMGEKWQMLSPNSSSCFNEGQNVGLLDTVKNVREIGRLTGKNLDGHLFTVWKPVTCKRDLAYLPVLKAMLATVKSAARAWEINMGGLSIEQKLTNEDLLNDLAPYPSILRDAINKAKEINASDIHIEPHKDGVLIRIRVHGDLFTFKSLSLEHRESFIQEAKRICNLSIAISNRPQDSRVNLPKLSLALRVNSTPIIYGEKIVLRLLDMETDFNLEHTGLSRGTITDLRLSANEKNGVIIISGPTGSGKTRTLFSLLNSLDKTKKNIVSLEDPVEYTFKGINQIQISKTVTFADGLRAILRQDPDVILVGEIRDFETADLCFKASATGHLVLSTLHANSSLKVIERLKNMGVEEYMIQSNLRFSAAQRLVKKTCKHCLNKKVKGCSKCINGSSGRIPLMEYTTSNELKDFNNIKVKKSFANDIDEKVQKGILSKKEVINFESIN